MFSKSIESHLAEFEGTTWSHSGRSVSRKWPWIMHCMTWQLPQAPLPQPFSLFLSLTNTVRLPKRFSLSTVLSSSDFFICLTAVFPSLSLSLSLSLSYYHCPSSGLSLWLTITIGLLAFLCVLPSPFVFWPFSVSYYHRWSSGLSLCLTITVRPLTFLCVLLSLSFFPLCWTS